MSSVIVTEYTLDPLIVLSILGLNEETTLRVYSNPLELLQSIPYFESEFPKAP